MTTKKLNQTDVLKWSLRGSITALRSKKIDHQVEILKGERTQKLTKIKISAFYSKLKQTKDIKLKSVLKSEIETLQSNLAKNKKNITYYHDVVKNIKEEK